MKRLLLIIFLVSLSIAKPVLNFSDLVTGPRSGWSNVHPRWGCAVTIWGTGFTSTRGSDYVSIGNIDLTGDSSYAEWGRQAIFPTLKQITFWLNQSVPNGWQYIKLHVNGETADDSIRFYVSSAHCKVFFCDSTATAGGNGSYENPFRNPTVFIQDSAKAGSILYLKGSYSADYNGGQQNVWIRPTDPPGDDSGYIAFVSYPCSTATFRHATEYACFQFDQPYYMVSKLELLFGHAGVLGAYENTGLRAVGCEFDGFTVHIAGSGMINSGRNAWIYGNTFHGGRTGDRLDHAIYVGGCPSLDGADVGWNYVYDNNFASGPMIVANSQDNRCPKPEVFGQFRVHDNIIDCTNYPSRGINPFHLSYEYADSISEYPDTFFVYNNILIGCGDSLATEYDYPVPMASIEVHNCGVGYIVNNTILGGKGYGISAVAMAGPIDKLYILNNIIDMDPVQGLDYLSCGAWQWKPNTPIFQNNLMYGKGTYTMSVINQDTPDSASVFANPLVNATTWIPASNSPVIDAGQNIFTERIKKDFYNNDRIYNSTIDLGAVEYGSSSGGGETTPDPVITSVSPACAAIGDTLTINGTDLGASGAVSINGQSHTPISRSNTQIKVIVACSRGRNLTVSVSNGSGFDTATVNVLQRLLHLLSITGWR